MDKQCRKYALVIVDCFSKLLELIPLRTSSSKIVATTFLETFIVKFGSPLRIVSDNGTQFKPDIYEQWCQFSNIAHVLQSLQATPDLDEPTDRTLMEMIGVYLSKFHKNWNRHLAKFTYGFRTAMHHSRWKIPAELILRRMLLTPFKKLPFTENQLSQRERADFDKFIAEAWKVLEQAQSKQA